MMRTSVLGDYSKQAKEKWRKICKNANVNLMKY